MAMKFVNYRGYSIEALTEGNTRVRGFKVWRRAYFPGSAKKVNYEDIGTFPYFTDAARCVAQQISSGIQEKDDLLVFFLTEIYAEGDDFI